MQIGRFTSFDPIGGDLRVPQSWNRASYVVGNPLKWTDPSGMFEVGFAAAVYIQQQFYDEITVVAGFNGLEMTVTADAARLIDQSSFRNFLFGNHAGGGGHNQARRDLRLSVREYANFVSANGGAGDCSGYSCKVLGGVGELAPFAEALDQAAIELSLALIPGPVDNAAFHVLGVGSKFSPQQRALVALAKEAAQRGVSRAEAKVLREWAKEYGMRSRGPEAHQGRGFGANEHLHIGPVNHIKVNGG